MGGALCLDLANTTGARATGRPRERLHRYDDLLIWSSRAGASSAADVARLRRLARGRDREADAALGRLCKVREELHVLFRAVAEGRDPAATALRRLGAWWRIAQSRRELVWAGGAFELRLRVAADELDQMLWPVVASAVDLLTSERLARVRRCGECDWLFVDESRNGSRTWCKKQCADRIRARRHYRRKRQEA